MSEKLNTCLKCFVVFINVIFFMFGCGLIAGGVYILTNKGFGAINTPILEHFAYAVIGIGVFTFLLSAVSKGFLVCPPPYDDLCSLGRVVAMVL